LQHIAGHPGYRAPAANEAGFLGLRAHAPNIRDLKSHLSSRGVSIVASEDDDDPFGLPSFEIRDPDGVPVFFNQIALWVRWTDNLNCSSQFPCKYLILYISNRRGLIIWISRLGDGVTLFLYSWYSCYSSLGILSETYYAMLSALESKCLFS